MEGFKSRLIDEQAQLQGRVERLEAFLQKDKANEIDSMQKTLLGIQLRAMTTYLTILNERIRLLG